MDPATAVATLPLLSAALSVASAAMFFLVARTVWVRPVSQESQLARNAFVLWWAILGAVTLVGIVLQLPDVHIGVTGFLTFTVVALALLCVGLWGLLYYLLFLFTNRRGLALPLALGYIVYFAFLTAFILAGGPHHIEQTKWGPQLESDHPIDSGPVYWAAILLLILPPFLAAAGYLSLYWKVDQPVQKRRILLVSMSILVWFGSSLITSGSGTSQSDVGQIVSRLIGLGAAATIYYAYRGLKPATPHAHTPSKETGTDTALYAPPRKELHHVLPLVQHAASAPSPIAALA